MTSANSGPAGEWPLVGRDGELRLLTELLRRPDARGVVLAGLPGTGRTRLGMEWLDAAQRAGLPTARIVATRATMATPYAAVAHLAPEPTGGPGSGTADVGALVTTALTALAADGGRVAIVVDDAQFLDGPSATLIHQLVSRGLGPVLIALRTREAVPETVTALWKEGLLERVELAPLDGQRVEQLLATALDAPVDLSVVVRLAARCRGNLVFLRELVVGATAAGTLVREGGGWRLNGPLAPTARLVELVETRLAGLNDDQRLVLAALTAGEVLGPGALGAVVDIAVVEHVEAKCHILGTVSGQRLEFRLAHPVHGVVIRARLSVLRYRRLLALLAKALEAMGARRAEDVLALARWRLEIGGAPADLLVAGSARAIRHQDFALAERLAEAAVEAGGGFPARLAAARALSVQGRGPEADAALLRLDANAGNDEERVQVTVQRLENLARLGRDAEGLAVAARATATIEGPAAQYEVEAARLVLLLSCAGPAATADAVDALRRQYPDRRDRDVGAVSALALSRRGSVVAALAGLEEIGDDQSSAEGAADEVVAARVAPPVDFGWIGDGRDLVRAEVLASAGRLLEARTVVSAQYEAAVARASAGTGTGGGAGEQAWIGLRLAKVLLLQGRVASAARYARESSGRFRQLRWPSALHQALIPLATSLALRGRAQEAAEVLGELDTLGVEPGASTAGDLLRARAWTAVAAGDLAGGRRLLGEAAEVARRAGDRVGECAALHDAARTGAAGQVADALAAVAADMEGDLAAARAFHASALADGDAGRLQIASTTFEGLSALLIAAEAAADAAVALRRAGRARAAAAEERRSADFAGQCEGAVTPSLGGVETRALLTAAERETALLAARGESNKAIADALYLSVRTVENRLQRVYEKLGVSGRASLADALGG